MSMYKQFVLSERLERDGHRAEFDGFVVTLARVGSEPFNARLRQLMKPYRGKVNTEIRNRLFTTAFAEKCVLNWEREIDGQLVQGIEGPDGSTLEFNVENVRKTLEALPRLYERLAGEASDEDNYREEDAGN